LAASAALNQRAELHLHPPRHYYPAIPFEKVGDAALARLAIDADHAITSTTDG